MACDHDAKAIPCRAIPRKKSQTENTDMKSKLCLFTLLAFNTVALCASENPSSADPGSITRVRHITIFVRDYDEALNWFTSKLGFAKVEDKTFGKDERWLVVAPAEQKEIGIVLAKVAGNSAQKEKDRIGATKNWVFETKDCQKAYEIFAARGVHFVQTPQKLPWGTQAIFEDLYGDEFVLLSHG